jgi:hypothetical protein
MVRCSLAIVLALGLSVLGCVKTDEGKGKGGSAGNSGGAGGGGGGGKDATAAADAITTCRDIRECVFKCGKDSACAASCVAVAPQAARAQYDQARMCSMGVCSEQDIDCRCMEECLGGTCTQIFDECDEAMSDSFCDGPCH